MDVSAGTGENTPAQKSSINMVRGGVLLRCQPSRGAGEPIVRFVLVRAGDRSLDCLLITLPFRRFCKWAIDYSRLFHLERRPYRRKCSAEQIPIVARSRPPPSRDKTPALMEVLSRRSETSMYEGTGDGVPRWQRSVVCRLQRMCSARYCKTKKSNAATKSAGVKLSGPKFREERHLRESALTAAMPRLKERGTYGVRHPTQRCNMYVWMFAQFPLCQTSTHSGTEK
mmetsp:Transcript_62042/g.183267  ORF Transcript_62042/g.183267 Transcript_62042/m.183267 type:complete len:227 (+) Transcript_62042:442-1122(+)